MGVNQSWEDLEKQGLISIAPDNTVRVPFFWTYYWIKDRSTQDDPYFRHTWTRLIDPYARMTWQS